MSIRLEALSRAVFDLFPPGLEPAYVAVTTLGDAAFLTALLSLAYLAGRRRRETAVVVAYAFAGYAVVLGLKAYFGHPRPPAALIAVDGHGFPSGHALASTVVYGGLAVEYGWRDRRAAAAGAVAATVALSRVALRVHYLGDVLVGAALGVALLAALHRVGGSDPRRDFAAAAALSVPALALTGAGPEAVGVLGGSLGGLAGSVRLDAIPPLRSRVEAAALAVVGLPLLGAVKFGVDALPRLPGMAGLDDFLLVLAVLLLPLAFERAGVTGWLAARGVE